MDYTCMYCMYTLYKQRLAPIRKIRLHLISSSLEKCGRERRKETLYFLLLLFAPKLLSSIRLCSKGHFLGSIRIHWPRLQPGEAHWKFRLSSTRLNCGNHRTFAFSSNDKSQRRKKEGNHYRRWDEIASKEERKGGINMKERRRRRRSETFFLFICSTIWVLKGRLITASFLGKNRWSEVRRICK